MLIIALMVLTVSAMAVIALLPTVTIVMTAMTKPASCDKNKIEPRRLSRS